jgi:peptidyl-tRNA hydrolase, PTH1 family
MDAMIVGLGNPGKKYDQTRHNLGFMALDAAHQQWVASPWKIDKNWQADIAKVTLKGHTLLLIKPQTYMNLSGQSVGPLSRYYQLPPDKVLVVVDDINLPFGRMRFRASGSPGGHNGLKSVEQHLGTPNYPRLRLGVGLQADSQPLTDHVLSTFKASEVSSLPALLDHTITVIANWLDTPSHQLLPLANGWILPQIKQC